MEQLISVRSLFKETDAYAGKQIKVGGGSFADGDAHKRSSHRSSGRLSGREKLPWKPWLPGECSVL